MTIVSYGRNVHKKDIDDNLAVRTLSAKQLKDLFISAYSQAEADGTPYNSDLCEEFQEGFKSLHFFQDGAEVFQVFIGISGAPSSLLPNAERNIGSAKLSPAATIIDLIFTQVTISQNQAIGTRFGIFQAIGDTGTTFQIIQDLANAFELTENNILRNTILLNEGLYPIAVKAIGEGGSEYEDSFVIVVSGAGVITNITLSSLSVEVDALVDDPVGVFTIQGGAPPASFELIDDGGGIFKIINDDELVVASAPVGIVGDLIDITVKATDLNAETRQESFTIEVVLNAFINTNSLQLNGTTKYLEAPDSPSMGVKTVFSISAWIKPNNTGVIGYITSKFGAGGERAWGLRVNAAGTLAFVFSQTGVAADTSTSIGSVTFGAWQHIVVTFDGTAGEVTFYINGVADSQDATLLTSIAASNVDFLIGALYLDTVSVQSHYSGFLDEMYYYDSALALSDVEDIYHTGVPRDNESLASWANIISGYRMGDDFVNPDQPDLLSTNDMTAVNMNNGDKSTDIP